MKEFIDLRGASGALYRFRRWAEAAPHQPIAGNYVVVREEPSGFSVLLAAATDDLSTSRSACDELAARHGGAHLFTRLNVSRAARHAENDDILAAYEALM